MLLPVTCRVICDRALLHVHEGLLRASLYLDRARKVLKSHSKIAQGQSRVHFLRRIIFRDKAYPTAINEILFFDRQQQQCVRHLLRPDNARIRQLQSLEYQQLCPFLRRPIELRLINLHFSR